MVPGTKISFRMTAAAGIFGALMVLLIPLKWLTAWLFSSVLHELSHCLALWICGRRIESICIGAAGAKIQSELLSDRQTVFCSLSGPVGSLFLLLVADTFPRLAVCALVQSCYNLLPVFPLDGGRALRSLTYLVFPEKFAQKFCRIIEILVAVLALVLTLAAGMFFRLGFFPVGVALLLLFHIRKIKIPCK